MTLAKWQDGPASALEWVGNFDGYYFFSFCLKKDGYYVSQIPKILI